MDTINKQKFLAELAKLLTFMYEDDRQRALTAYNEMFDEAEDEQMLLQALVSPLRQAVEVARAYNTGKQGMAAAKPDENGETSQAFMETIYRIRAEALSTQAAPAEEEVNTDQFSLFEEAPELEAAPEDAVEPVEAALEESPETAAPAQELPAAEAAPEAPEAPAEVLETPAPTPVPELVPVKSAPAPKAEATPKAARSKSPERLPVQKTVRKPRVLLLILYIILAIPLTLLGVVILLVPALASLVAAAACIAVAIMAVTSAFGSFPKLANLLVALGASLILLAVGLVFLMLFIWFLGGAIGGLIHGVIELGGKWCYKEVPAE